MTSPLYPGAGLTRRRVVASAAAVGAGLPAMAAAFGRGTAPFAGFTVGGAGGTVMRVTTLAADGPGSLAAAISADGPRQISFDVGGVIDLGQRVLTIRNPYVTIDAGAAPDPGVTIIRGGLRVATHDVIIRHLMVRPGDAGAAKGSGWEADGIAVDRGANVHVEHCSLSWATDENLSASGPRFDGEGIADWRAATSHRIAFLNCLIAEGLSNASHSKGEHSKGLLIHDNVRDVVIAGNILASNRERNALFKGGAQGVFAGNLVYNPGRRFLHYNLHAGEWAGQTHVEGVLSIVGNEFRAGPSTPADAVAIALGGEGPLRLHMRDNLLTAAPGAVAPTLFGRFGSGDAVLHEVDAAPYWPDGLAVPPARETFASTLRQAGARPLRRGPVDARIIDDILAGRGRIIDSQDEVGGYPPV